MNLNKILNEKFDVYGLNIYVQPLIDSIETHGIYGITSKELLSEIKEYLKTKGGSNFRTVNVYGKFWILCLKFPK